MGPRIDVQLVNGLAGDPAVCVQFTQAGDSILFDAGSLDGLSNRDLLKIRVIAVSHTHVDHFIGFDRLIRVNVPHFRTLEVIGPTGIIANIRGKLAGYTWNLLEPDQLTFIVHEISKSGAIKSVKLSNTWNFEDRPLAGDAGCTDATNITRNENPASLVATIPLQHKGRYSLSATVLDHGTDVLAFCLTLPDTLAVNKEELAKLPHQPGQWIAELQRKSSQGTLSETINIDGLEVPTKDLATNLLEPRPGQCLLYVTDIVFSLANLDRLKALAPRPLDLLICEANYRSVDKAKAQAKSHLTTIQAALIGALLSAKKLQIFHVSNLYAGDFETSASESESAFSKFQLMSPPELLAAASQEYRV